jgi:hypothetical protein
VIIDVVTGSGGGPHPNTVLLYCMQLACLVLLSGREVCNELCDVCICSHLDAASNLGQIDPFFDVYNDLVAFRFSKLQSGMSFDAEGGL